MFYEKFKPHDTLQPFVECYFVWHSDEPIHNLVVESPPSGYCSIVFNCGDDYFLQNKKYERLAVPKQFIAGQAIYSYKLFLDSNISIAGIVFKPTALATLFFLPMYEYTEERRPLTSIFNSNFITLLAKKISNAKDSNEKVKLLEEFVMTAYAQNEPVPDCIDYAANLIIEKSGMMHITAILKEIYMSRRNFERRFFKKVGLSPKYYARIIRMGYIFKIIAGKKKV